MLCTFYFSSLSFYLHVILPLPPLTHCMGHLFVVFLPPFDLLCVSLPSAHTVTPLALHVLLPGTPHNQDHSGTLGPEEFKACLISLGYDIGNDAQVLNASGEHSQILNCEKITVFFLSFLVCLNPSVILVFDYVCIIFLYYFLPKCTLVSIPS